ncbi:MAG: multiple sugar transport system ATP-binding protein [Psychromonas sp.]|jgi:multiple sugar transport system ATP-binding protein|uniref:ABC transporter ATP-binding protein n=1 Tax=Psychromonas sp. TaxID=1884585 RepID=UPI0039E6690A
MHALKIQNIEKTYGKVKVLKGIDLEIEPGQFLILVGPSGCGKSTLLNMIAGLEPVSNGQIFIGDRDVTDLDPKDRDIAMVFQSYALYPNMTVRQNISFGLTIRKVEKTEQNAIVDKVSKLLQIEPLLDRKPKQLSGGQRQRVAMGRALARDPSIFLFDEPLSNLDAKLRVEMRSEIKELHQRVGTTIVYVTHDQIEAMTLGDVIAVMKEGEIQQMGSPQEIYDNPRNQFIAGFMGSPSMNFIPCQIEKVDGVMQISLESGGVKQQLPIKQTIAGLESYAGQTVIFGIRPEQITQQGEEKVDSAMLNCSVEIIEPTGPDTLITVRINGIKTVCRIHPTSECKLDVLMPLLLDMSKVVFFDAQTEQRIY